MAGCGRLSWFFLSESHLMRMIRIRCGLRRLTDMAYLRHEERLLHAWGARRELLLGVLDGVELGPDGERLVERLAGWDDGTVTTTVLLVGAARAAGALDGADE